MLATIEKQKQLRSFNTFAIAAKAHFFAAIETIEQLQEILQSSQFSTINKLILGGGSNILFTQDINALVLQIKIPGIEHDEENHKSVCLKVSAGVNWHDLVSYCVQHHYYGIENLALIPGSVGAAPIQNIGAYGVELCDVFEQLDAINIKTGEMKTFTHAQCQFGYRDSIFKHNLKNQWIITHVYLRLSKLATLNTHYAALTHYLEQHHINHASIDDIYHAVIAIRQSKLPDPETIANAGSFFKNPVITKNLYEKLKSNYSALPHYPVDDTHVKLPAAWLIDQCGFKGIREGDAGVHTQQALVLVNHSQATGHDIIQLAKKIQHTVNEKFTILLEPEVNII